MTPKELTDSEKAMAHVILRWWRAQAGPRHGQIAAEAALVAVAEKLAGKA